MPSEPCTATAHGVDLMVSAQLLRLLNTMNSIAVDIWLRIRRCAPLVPCSTNRLPVVCVAVRSLRTSLTELQLCSYTKKGGFVSHNLRTLRSAVRTLRIGW